MAVGHSAADIVIPEKLVDRESNICYPVVMVARDNYIVAAVAVEEERRTCKQDGRK
jgi:hypothetical protein